VIGVKEVDEDGLDAESGDDHVSTHSLLAYLCEFLHNFLHPDMWCLSSIATTTTVTRSLSHALKTLVVPIV
jgi:hypothetical protein